MAVLNRSEFLDRLHAAIGDEVTEETISLVEDFTDTYDDLEQRSSSGEADVWKQKYEENDKAWKTLYQNRFFSGAPASQAAVQLDQLEETDVERAENIKVEDLFTPVTK